MAHVGLQRICPYLCQYSPQHCRGRAAPQGPISETTSCSLLCAAPLPGLDLLLPSSTLLSMFHYGIRAGKPGHGFLSSWGGGTPPGQGGLWTSLLLYCTWGGGACPGGVTSVFPPEITSLEHCRCGCTGPKEPSMPVPSRAHEHGEWHRGCSSGHSTGAGNQLGHTCPTTGEALMEGAQGGLYHAASPAPLHRAHNRTIAPHRPPPPPSSPARPGQAHGRRLC